MARADVSPYVGWNEARATSGACRCRPDYCRHQGGVLVFMPDRISNWLRLPQLFRSYGTITATRFELARDLWRTPRPLPSFRWPRRKRVTASTAKLRSARLLLSEDRYSTPRCCYVYGKKREGEIGDRETVANFIIGCARRSSLANSESLALLRGAICETAFSRFFGKRDTDHRFQLEEIQSA